MLRVTPILYAVCVVAAADLAVRRTDWGQLPAPTRAIATQLGINAANFKETITAIDQRTAERLRDGEWDQLVYYMLQSRSFTQADPIEPARSAAEFVPAMPRQVPARVQARMDALLAALLAPSDERQRYFAKIIPSQGAAHELELRYARAMEFLYEKEIRCRNRANPQGCIAELYTDRGLSSDTSTQAFRVVEAAVAWMKENRPDTRPRRVLIIGPGVDFASRTALKEDAPPRVYQPGQAIDLLRLDYVDCIDINPLVIAYAKSACASTYQMNIATGFVDAAPGWDLIIATNVLLYLDDRELLLAMNNVRRMLNPGGIFLHNDGRFSAELFGKACGLPVIRFGDIVLDARRSPPLVDRYVLHEVAPPAL